MHTPIYINHHYSLSLGPSGRPSGPQQAGSSKLEAGDEASTPSAEQATPTQKAGSSHLESPHCSNVVTPGRCPVTPDGWCVTSEVRHG